MRRNGNGRAARQAPIVPGQRMPRNRRAGRGGGAVGGGPGRERDAVNPNVSYKIPCSFVHFFYEGNISFTACRLRPGIDFAASDGRSWSANRCG